MHQGRKCPKSRPQDRVLQGITRGKQEGKDATDKGKGQHPLVLPFFFFQI
jgi:hypothetical protein